MNQNFRIVMGLILIFVSIITFYILKVKTPYEKDYFGKAGLANVYAYSDLVKLKGAPLKVDEIKQDDGTGRITIYKDLHYQGYVFRLAGNMLVAAEITAPNYKLGNKKIGIGSTFKDVKKAYRHVRSILDVKCGYIEGTTWVEFKFDANNKVNLIKISRNP